MHRLITLSFCSFYLNANSKKASSYLSQACHIYFSDEVTLLRNSSWVVFATSGSAKLHIYPASESVSLELHSSLVAAFCLVSARRKLHSLSAVPVCTVTKQQHCVTPETEGCVETSRLWGIICNHGESFCYFLGRFMDICFDEQQRNDFIFWQRSSEQWKG